MLRFLKLTAYVLFGYFLYEAIRGIGDPRPARVRVEQRQGHDDGFRTEPVWDSSGAQNTHKVGRGVIS
jgi:hypothetical protein